MQELLYVINKLNVAVSTHLANLEAVGLKKATIIFVISPLFENE